MASRLCTWLLRKLGSREKKQDEEMMLEDLQPRPAPDSQKHTPPPPYTTVNLPRDAQANPPTSTPKPETLEALRNRNPVARLPREGSAVLRPPKHKKTPYGAARAAAAIAVIGMVRALDEHDRKMIAARAIRAVAVAVSTSRSYAAFVAATTAAESAALICLEADRDNEAHSRVRQRIRHSGNRAAETALAADAGITPIGAWPHNIHDTSSVTSACMYISIVPQNCLFGDMKLKSQ